MKPVNLYSDKVTKVLAAYQHALNKGWSPKSACILSSNVNHVESDIVFEIIDEYQTTNKVKMTSVVGETMAKMCFPSISYGTLKSFRDSDEKEGKSKLYFKDITLFREEVENTNVDNKEIKQIIQEMKLKNVVGLHNADLLNIPVLNTNGDLHKCNSHHLIKLWNFVIISEENSSTFVHHIGIRDNDPDFLKCASYYLSKILLKSELEPEFFDLHVLELYKIMIMKLNLPPKLLPGLRNVIIETIVKVAESNKWQIPLKSSWIETNDYDLPYYCANIFWPAVYNEVMKPKINELQPVLPNLRCKHCGKKFENSFSHHFHEKEVHEHDNHQSHFGFASLGDWRDWDFSICSLCGKLCLTSFDLLEHHKDKHKGIDAEWKKKLMKIAHDFNKDKSDANVILEQTKHEPVERLNTVRDPIERHNQKNESITQTGGFTNDIDSDTVVNMIFEETKDESTQKEQKKKKKLKSAKSDIPPRSNQRPKHESKSRINSYQTEGNPDDYDLDKVLEALGEIKVQSKPKKLKNKKKIKQEKKGMKETIASFEKSTEDGKEMDIDEQNNKIEELNNDKQVKNHGKEDIVDMPLKTENVQDHVQPDPSKEDFKPIQEYIDSIESENRSLKVSQQFYNAMVEKYEKLKKKLETINESRLCKICLEEDSCMVFIPCGHVMSCENCSFSCKNCAICRKPIRSKFKTYFS